MPVQILGISAFYHDAAACLLQDGKLLAAAQEERFSRIKHDPGFPVRSVQYCLGEAGIAIQDVDLLAFYDKPLLKFERLLETYLRYAPRGLFSFWRAMPLWLKRKLWIPDIIRRELGYEGKILYPDHHLSHAASAFYPSPFHEAAILTMDGVGEWTTTSWGVGTGNEIEILKEIHFPHSLGLLYSAFTYYCGFKVNSGEYKLMGLAPYGEPRYADLIKTHLIDIKPDGSFWLDMSYFNYPAGLTMTNRRFHQLFGGPPRQPEGGIDQRHMDLAASIQRVVEDLVCRVATHIRSVTDRKNLCLAGGVALNCVANGLLVKKRIFDKIWIQPAAGDAGGAVGAAFIAWHKSLAHPRSPGDGDAMGGALLGPSYTDEELKRFMDQQGIIYDTPDDLSGSVAEVLENSRVVGWFQGRMEFGPRALGSRSILGDPRSPATQSVINRKIKFRESFRPFAPSILEEHVSEYFEPPSLSPYMLLVSDVHAGHRISVDGNAPGFEKLHQIRSTIPAVTHVDHSARMQTVNRHTHPVYHALISRFYERTGVPLIVNTSFNVRGEPIVQSPEEAYNCFMLTDMDVLVLGPFVINKKDQPPQVKVGDSQVHNKRSVDIAYD